MDQVMINDILKSIKSDDLVAFSTLTKGKINLCLGRFPLLTLCYIYGAKRIIKQYFKSLSKIKIYNFVSEPFEAYRAFKMKAGRILRLYTKEKSLVSPAEMLAILHKDFSLKRNYKYFPKTDSMIKNLTKIYSIYGQKVEATEEKIKIALPKLTGRQKVSCVMGVVFGIVMMLAVASGYGACVYSLGTGSASLPYKISSESRFYQVLNEPSQNYVLTKDIEIYSLTQIEVNGTLDGNNHTIYIKSLPTTSFISKNNGTIKNLNIVYTNITQEVSNSLSLFVGDNNGTISNVNVCCNSLNLTFVKSEQNDLYFGAVAINNNGTIENCNLKLTANFVGIGEEGECLASGIVGINNKDIKNCTFEEGSITTNAIDVAGIVAVNNYLVEDCKNNASIKQISSLNGWSPNASGICMINNVSIIHSINTGTIIVESTLDEENSSGNVLIAGICATNLGEIQKCLNKGEIQATSKQIIVYAGGICASSEYTTPNGYSLVWAVINDCGNQGDINISTVSDNAYVFAGGICGGVKYSYVTNCYSLAKFQQGYTKDRYYMGTFVGTIDVDSYGLCINTENIYVEQQDNITYQVASRLLYYYVNGELYQISIKEGGDLTDIVFTQTSDEIKAQGVYWDE